MPFPPHGTTDYAETEEVNRGRPEIRQLTRFDVTPEQLRFPGVQQAAMMLRWIVPARKEKDSTIEREWLITSMSNERMSAAQMLNKDRNYWQIESGLHYRLDVSADEDKSHVRNKTAVLNLSMIRRATMSLAIHWIQKCKKSRMATMSGFYDHMSKNNGFKAFSLVTSCKASWLPP